MGKNYDLYSPYQRTIDNLKRRIRGYEKMKKDLTKQYRKTNKENQELKEQNKKYKEVFDKLKKLIEEKQEIQSEEAGFYDVFTDYITINVDELLEILEEVE